MKFDPKTDEETKNDKPFPVWPSGQYDFEIMNGVDKKSKAGNEMIELRVKIFNSEGEEKIVFDYLLESVAYKLRHCAEACGLMEKYEKGELVGGDFDGCTGKLKLRVGKPTEEYPDPKNEVADYVVGTAAAEPKPKYKKALGAEDLDDSIPFSFLIAACAASIMMMF